MTLRSLILEMRSRSHRVVHDLASAADSTPASSESNRWSDIPEELLREILIRVEAADGGGWPSRRSVVACAGVCRGWRLLMNETVAVPEISSKLTFPISLKQPGPRESLVQCFIKRNRATQSYHLYLGFVFHIAEDGSSTATNPELKGSEDALGEMTSPRSVTEVSRSTDAEVLEITNLDPRASREDFEKESMKKASDFFFFPIGRDREQDSQRRRDYFVRRREVREYATEA
ncbi:hypothetical protein Bca52824_036652 [Brassica carinata]|uniref:F-box domain-containing protein n=1 Tax=Brassica carinata TaxID=52824 RepID=A0A8X7V1Q8_BRACI|nr:hypothetical protein Bca52824_036652 [Brassica carinata]